MLNYKSIILFTGLFAISLYADAALNDTGITTCSNETQNDLPCPVAGFPGQDAEYGTNSFDFTKLDANGNAMSVAATNHSCVQDNVTGLMWEVKTDDGGLRDKDNTYTFDQAATFAANVNATNLCGHNDWRLPNIYELASIVDYSVYDSSIDENFFPYTSNSYYWTNDQYAAYSSGSWIVGFGSGFVGSNYRDGYGFVRCVRLGQWLLPLVFTDQGNGTVTEASTGLMWAKCSVGQGATDCSGSPSSLTWQQALQAADNSTVAGYTDWRLPNVKELQTLVDYTKYSPSINPSVFPNTPSAWYYSSSPYAAHSSNSWIVLFGGGGVYGDGRGYGSFVRCVRLGQWLLPLALSVAKAGNGAGSVSSNPAGINCGSDCNENYASGTVVKITATAATGSVFVGWSGDADCSDGTVTMNTDKNCTATFNLNITAPTATTGTATNITQTSAKLNGTVISSGATATVSFEFGKETSPPAIVPTLQRGNAYRDAPASRKVAQTDTTTLDHRGLRSHAGAWERSETHYSPLQSWVGSGGEVKSFTYTETIAATPSTVYSSTAVAVNANKTGLTCGTTYHYRTKAINSAGTSMGANKTFTTNACIYTVTATAGSGGTVTPSTATVTYGATASFTVTPNPGSTRNNAVGGTCPQGNWNGNVWTTGAITTNCNVHFTFTPIINGVCGSANGDTFPTAPTANLCNAGSATAVTGTGPWNWTCTGTNGGTTASCSANIAEDNQFLVTPSVTANGTVNPSTPQTVSAGALQTFTVTPAVGYIKDFVVGGTCPQGSWNENNRWTTGPITANCSVIFNFTEQPTAWLSPTNPYTTVSGKLALDLRVDSSGAKVKSYSFDIKFDQTKILVETNFPDTTGHCQNGVCPGTDALSNNGFTVDNTMGSINLIGFDTQGGAGPRNDLQLLTIHFKMRQTIATTPIELTLNQLRSEDNDEIGNGFANNALVTIQRYQCGDANGDTFINIIDALSIARQIIGLPPPPSITPVADVNTNGEISIVDAMHIARYSLGLVVVGTCLM